MVSSEVVRYSLLLPKDLWVKAKVKAVREGKRLSEVIRELLEEWVEYEEEAVVKALEKPRRESCRKITEFQVSEPSSTNSSLPSFLENNPWLEVLSRKHS